MDSSAPLVYLTHLCYNSMFGKLLDPLIRAQVKLNVSVCVVIYSYKISHIHLPAAVTW